MSKLWLKSLWTKNFSQIDIINNVLFIEKNEEQFYIILKIAYMQPDYKTSVVKSNTNNKLYSVIVPNFIITKSYSVWYISFFNLFYMYISTSISFSFLLFSFLNFFFKLSFLNLKPLKNRQPLKQYQIVCISQVSLSENNKFNQPSKSALDFPHTHKK